MRTDFKQVLTAEGIRQLLLTLKPPEPEQAAKGKKEPATNLTQRPQQPYKHTAKGHCIPSQPHLPFP